MEDQNKTTQEKNSKEIQTSSNDNTLSVVSHLLCNLGFLGPLVMYLIYKDTATENLKKNIISALNYSIFYSLAVVACTIIFIFAFIIPVLSIVTLVFSILGAMEANKGGVYKYPVTFNFIK